MAFGGEADFLARHVCARCGSPRALEPAEDYFTAFAVPRRFVQDRAELERRFYQASRALHPDRFGAASVEARKASVERMSLLNDAYGTLRDPEALREYLLRLEGVEPPKAGIPEDLAESWFELQDTLGESPELARTRLEVFETELQLVKSRLESVIRTLEGQSDREGLPREVLEKLARQSQARNYLRSLERDLERIRGKLCR
ncbi:MAG: hypothetical protein NDJ89_00215 [Oligoflexia bacterium]|nr:hypothetical protein [Oligoflexia bacterium]